MGWRRAENQSVLPFHANNSMQGITACEMRLASARGIRAYGSEIGSVRSRRLMGLSKNRSRIERPFETPCIKGIDSSATHSTPQDDAGETANSLLRRGRPLGSNPVLCAPPLGRLSQGVSSPSRETRPPGNATLPDPKPPLRLSRLLTSRLNAIFNPAVKQ